MKSVTSTSGVSSRSRPPYLMGLLGLIPLVGFFVGLVLFLYGWLRYKDKKLIFIGIGGMLWSVLLYGTLFWVLDHEGPAEWKTLSQAGLDNLICHIEFYHLEHGVYPDSLQQIKKERPSASLFDPMMSTLHLPDSMQNYVYYPISHHYTLFARGIDGLAHTPDDLFPQILTHDSSKIGWVHP